MSGRRRCHGGGGGRGAGRTVVEVHVRDAADLERVAATLRAIGDDAPAVDVPTRSARVRLGADTAKLFAALRPLDEVGVSIDEVSVRQPTLDEAFLALINSSAEVAA